MSPCRSEIVKTASLIVGTLNADYLNLTLLKVFIQYFFFLSSTISTYNMGSWQIDLKCV